MRSVTDLLEAFQFGNQCVQDVSYFDILRFGDISEDCLSERLETKTKGGKESSYGKL